MYSMFNWLQPTHIWCLFQVRVDETKNIYGICAAAITFNMYIENKSLETSLCTRNCVENYVYDKTCLSIVYRSTKMNKK